MTICLTTKKRAISGAAMDSMLVATYELGALGVGIHIGGGCWLRGIVCLNKL